MKNGQLSGRSVLITGASSGLGERFARICAREGAAVTVGARRVDRIEALASRIVEDGGRAIAVPLDVTDEKTIVAAYDAADQAFGRVDSVVANAGIEISGPAVGIKADDFAQVFDVNVRGSFLTAREGARRMQEGGYGEAGRIVLISSITGKMRTPGIIPYSASKAAVSHMGAALAREWARNGPNVNCISPGYINTEMTADWFATEGGERQKKSFPRRRLVDEDALDTVLLYLLSDAARNTTGADIAIDDGQSL